MVLCRIWSILVQSAVRCGEVIALGDRHKKVELYLSDYLAFQNVADHKEVRTSGQLL